jgi:hypothetical protein
VNLVHTSFSLKLFVAELVDLVSLLVPVELNQRVFNGVQVVVVWMQKRGQFGQNFLQLRDSWAALLTIQTLVVIKI